MHNGLSYSYGSQSGTTNNLQAVVGIVFPGQTFYYNLFINGQVVLRRADTTGINRRCLVWMESSGSGTNVLLHPPYLDSMEQFLAGRIINRGTDNLFGNTGDGAGNNNNIERVDWIVSSGMKSSSAGQSGFAIFERGDDNRHDPFCIAAILALDSTGAPAQYGPLLRVQSTQYGNLPNSEIQTSVLRKEEAEPRLYRSATVLQKRGGVFITLHHLGVANNQTVYGYSLFANDMPASATSANLIDFTDTTYFPRNTLSTTGDGGIDLIAITGLFNTSNTAVTLPVTMNELAVIHRQGAVELSWKLFGEAGVRSLSVERSTDGVRWVTVAANLPPNCKKYIDPAPAPGSYFYRIQISANDGSSQVTPSRAIRVPVLYHPVLQVQQQSGKMLLSFTTNEPATAIISICDLAGRIIARRQIQAHSGTNRPEISIGSVFGQAIITVTAASWRLEKKILLR